MLHKNKTEQKDKTWTKQKTEHISETNVKLKAYN